jgi:hypothetical protein
LLNFLAIFKHVFSLSHVAFIAIVIPAPNANTPNPIPVAANPPSNAVPAAAVPPAVIPVKIKGTPDASNIPNTEPIYFFIIPLYSFNNSYTIYEVKSNSGKDSFAYLVIITEKVFSIYFGRLSFRPSKRYFSKYLISILFLSVSFLFSSLKTVSISE